MLFVERHNIGRADAVAALALLCFVDLPGLELEFREDRQRLRYADADRDGLLLTVLRRDVIFIFRPQVALPAAVDLVDFVRCKQIAAATALPV